MYSRFQEPINSFNYFLMTKKPLFSDLLDHYNFPDFRTRVQYDIWYKIDSKFEKWLEGSTAGPHGSVSNLKIYRDKLNYFLQDHPQVSLLYKKRFLSGEFVMFSLGTIAPDPKFETEKNRLIQEISMMETNIDILTIIKEHNEFISDKP